MKTFDPTQQPKRNPFTVPEDYFDTLTSRIMENIPEQPNPKTVELKPRQKNRWWIWTVAAAACVAIAAFFVTPSDPQTSSTISPQATAMLDSDDYSYDEQYQEDVLEYAMVDNNDIYSYLAGNY